MSDFANINNLSFFELYTLETTEVDKKVSYYDFKFESHDKLLLSKKQFWEELDNDGVFNGKLQLSVEKKC